MTQETTIFTLGFEGDSGNVDSTVSAVADALDHLDGTHKDLDRSTKNTSASTQQMSGVMNEAVKSVSSVSGEMGSAINVAHEFTSKITEAIGEEGGIGLLGLAGAATVAIGAMAEFGADGANLATQISQVSAVTGMSIEKTDYWSNALADVGGNANSLVAVNRLLTNSMESLINSQDQGNPLTQKQADLLQALGGSARDAHGQMLNFADAFPRIIGVLSSMTDEQERARFGTEIFGRAWGQVSLLVAEYPKVAASAEEQTARNAAAMEHAQDIAVNYHTAMHNLEVEYDALALRFAKPLTFTLNIAGNFFDNIDKVDKQAKESELHKTALDIERVAWEGVTLAVGNQINAISDWVSGSSQMDEHVRILTPTARDAGDAIDAAAGAMKNAGSSASNATPGLAGFAAVLNAMKGGAAIFNEVTTGENGLIMADIGLIKSNKEKADAMESAYKALAASSDPTERAIGQAHLDAEAQKAASAARHDGITSIAEETQRLDQQAQSAANVAAATDMWAAAHGRAVDREHQLIPLMSDEIAKVQDSYDAQQRDAAARRMAYIAMGLQVDREGNVIKSTQDMTNAVLDQIDAQEREAAITLQVYKENYPALVEAQKQEMLAQNEMQKASADATKQLVDQGLIADATAKSVDTLSSSMKDLGGASSSGPSTAPLPGESQAAYMARMAGAAGGGTGAIGNLTSSLSSYTTQINTTTSANTRAATSFSDLVRQEELNILESQKMQIVTQEANKALGLTDDAATSAASGINKLTLSMSDLAGIQKQINTLSLPGSGPAPTSGGGSSGGGASGGGGGAIGFSNNGNTFSAPGGSVSFFSSGGGGGSTNIYHIGTVNQYTPAGQNSGLALAGLS